MKPATSISTGVVASLLVATGCGGAPPPIERMASSEAAVRAASEVGAAKNPQASLQLRLAEEQLAKAKALMADGDNAEAELLLMRAQADAELALALSREAQAKADAQATLDQVQKLTKK